MNVSTSFHSYPQNRATGLLPSPGTHRDHLRPRDLRSPHGWNWRGTRRHGNLVDQYVGPGWRRNNPFCKKGDGFVIDLNNNGRYDRGRDGVLIFDTNCDGKYTKEDVANTNKMMKAAQGNFDFNGDGCVSLCERHQGLRYKKLFAKLDRNKDGKLDTREIACGGGKVWIDHSKGGGIGRNELHSPYNLPSDGGCWGGSRKLDWVDPNCGSQTSNRLWRRGPFGPFGPFRRFGHTGTGARPS